MPKECTRDVFDGDFSRLCDLEGANMGAKFGRYIAKVLLDGS